MRILIVDDVPAMRHFLRLILAEFRLAEVDQAGDGARAVQLLRQHRYDLVLLDLNMPLLDGFKVLAILRQSDPPERPTPVIIVTTFHGPETDERAHGLGVEHVLSKPVQASELLTAIRSIVGATRPSSAYDADRRRGERMLLQVAVTFEHEPPIQAETSDLTPFGAFIACDHVRPIGTRVRLALRLPHLAEAVLVDCHVVHVREQAIGALPRGFGVRFIHDDPAAYRRLLMAFTSPDEG